MLSGQANSRNREDFQNHWNFLSFVPHGIWVLVCWFATFDFQWLTVNSRIIMQNKSEVLLCIWTGNPKAPPYFDTRQLWTCQWMWDAWHFRWWRVLPCYYCLDCFLLWVKVINTLLQSVRQISWFGPLNTHLKIHVSNSFWLLYEKVQSNEELILAAYTCVYRLLFHIS